MVVVRSMQLTQKKTTATFKQLDGVIRATKPDGSKTSYTHKCGELDKTVPIMIGVSREVLESVIFCHQEDSSWPLQEGPRRRPNAVRTGSLKDQRDAATRFAGVGSILFCMNVHNLIVAFVSAFTTSLRSVSVWRAGKRPASIWP